MDIDSIQERHGRAYHLPWELSKMGHQVSGLFLDYRSSEGCWRRSDDRFSISVCSLKSRAFLRPDCYYRELRRVIRLQRPDIVIAGSDALNVVIGYHTAKRLKVPFVADIKDDYSAFGMTTIVPFLERAYYRCLKNADLITCASSSLQNTLLAKGISHTIALENAVPANFSLDITTEEARQKLNLPPDTFLFGVAGALSASRDIATVLEGAHRFLLGANNAALVLAGPRDENFDVSEDVANQVYDLGKLPPSKVPILFKALDLGVIPNKPGSFGNHCYPQKYNEMLACGLPICASRVGVFDTEVPQQGIVALFEAGDAESFLTSLQAYTRTPPHTTAITSGTSVHWSNRAQILNKEICKLLIKNHTN